MAKEKKEKPTSVDGILDELRETTSADHEESIKAYEVYSHPNEIKRRQNKIINPAFDGTSKTPGAYNSAVDKIDEITGKINESAKEKDKTDNTDEIEITEEDHLHKILNAYMSEALNKLHPKMMENIKEDLEQLAEKDKYEKLSSLFDGLLVYHENSEEISLSKKGKSWKKRKNSAAEIKEELSKLKEEHKKAVSKYLDVYGQQMYINSLPPGIFGKFVLDKLDKKGYEFESATNKIEFLSNPNLHRYAHKVLREEEEKEKKKRLNDIEGLVYKKAA